MPKASSRSLFYVNDFSEGLRTDVPANQAPINSLVKAENCRLIPKGGFHTRGGSEHVSAWAFGTSKPIYEMEKMLEHDCVFFQTGTKLFQANSPTATPYTLGVTITDAYRGRFVEYNSEMKFSNGKDIYMNITVGRVLTAFTQASTSIVMRPGNADLFRTPKTNTFTVNAGTDVITSAAAHGLNNGDRVAFTSSGTLPAGLATVTEYFVKNQTSTTFQVSATPIGAAVDITDTGSGTHTFTDGILYCLGLMITYTKKKSQTFTAVAANDTITSAAHALENGSIIQVSNSGGALPAGLSASTNYYVIDATTDTFKLSATYFGSAIDITDAGTGTHTFNAISGGDTFTGVTIPTGTYAADAIVTQTWNLPKAPKAKVLETIFEKMIAAGVMNAGHAMHYTVTANTDTPHNIDDFTGSGADTELFGKFGEVTAMKTLLNKMYVAKKKGVEAWTGIDSDGIPVREPFDDSYGVVNANCLVRFGNKLAMFTDTRRIKTVEPVNTSSSPEPAINPYFDLKISGTLQELDDDQDDARMGFNEHDFLLRISADQDTVSRTMIFHADAGGFTVDRGINPNCWLEWRGDMYYGSASNNAKVYKSETGFEDDGTAYTMDVLTPVIVIGREHVRGTLGYIVLTGYIMELTECVVTIYGDGESARTATLSGDEDYVSSSDARPFGREYMGIDPFGHSGGEDDPIGFRFKVAIDVNLELLNTQIRFLQSAAGRIQIDSIEGMMPDEDGSTSQLMHI